MSGDCTREDGLAAAAKRNRQGTGTGRTGIGAGLTFTRRRGCDCRSLTAWPEDNAPDIRLPGLIQSSSAPGRPPIRSARNRQAAWSATNGNAAGRGMGRAKKIVGKSGKTREGRHCPTGDCRRRRLGDNHFPDDSCQRQQSGRKAVSPRMRASYWHIGSNPIRINRSTGSCAGPPAPRPPRRAEPAGAGADPRRFNGPPSPPRREPEHPPAPPARQCRWPAPPTRAIP